MVELLIIHFIFFVQHCNARFLIPDVNSTNPDVNQTKVRVRYKTALESSSFRESESNHHKLSIYQQLYNLLHNVDKYLRSIMVSFNNVCISRQLLNRNIFRSCFSFSAHSTFCNDLNTQLNHAEDGTQSESSRRVFILLPNKSFLPEPQRTMKQECYRQTGSMDSQDYLWNEKS